jgi:hypothetical protein
MSSGAKPIETAARQRLRLSGCIDHRCHGGLGAACPLINCFPVLGEPNGDKASVLPGFTLIYAGKSWGVLVGLKRLPSR